MSTGLFMGIRSSFVEEAQDAASTFIAAVNRALADRDLPPYLDPAEAPHVYADHLFGRSALDHHSSRVLVDIANLGASARERPNLGLIRDNPFRVAFLPIEFSPPLQTEYFEQIGGDRFRIWAGSLPHLHLELSTIASDLGIPLKNGNLTDEVAAAINEFEPLYDGDSAELAENERTAWLALYEGARLALERNVALSLAG
jgi:hypothetical protein